MRIAAATQQFQARHQASQGSQQTSRLQSWTGARTPHPAPGDSRRPEDVPSAAQVRGKPGQITRMDSAEPTDAATAEPPLTPQMALIKALLERMTGMQIKVYAADLQGSPPPSEVSTAQPIAAVPPRSAGFGLLYEASTVHEESEHLDFQIQGQVQTADGRTIDLQLNLALDRVYREESRIRIALGDAVAPVDPLVLRFDGPAEALQDQRFAFDLQGNGTADSMPLLAQGWGYLALDRNSNSRIDNGMELFGPRTNNGFAELARLDADGNGWIDEADPAFDQLRIWRPGANGGGNLQTLQSAGVGALGLAHAASPFALRSGSNVSLGAVRTTGAYLREDGQAGVLQQIDLAV